MIIGFAGSPVFAQPALIACAREHTISYVLTQPERPRGRGQRLLPCPIDACAQEMNMRIYRPERLSAEPWQAVLEKHPIDVLVVASYGLLIPSWLLDLPRYGCVNIHPSDLPRWRGASPIHAPLLHGDTSSAVTIMHMEKGLDTGPIYMRQQVPINSQTTFQSLHDLCADIGAKLLIDTLAQLPMAPTPQSAEGITYAHKLTKQSHWYDISWSSAQCHQHLQAFYPKPGVLAHLDGSPIKLIWGQPTQTPSNKPAGTLVMHPDKWILSTQDNDYEISHIQYPNKSIQQVQQLKQTAQGYLTAPKET